MLKPIFDFMEKIATDFSWRRLGVFGSFILLVGLLIGIYEYYTSHFFFGKLEYALELLQKVEDLENSDAIKNDILLNNILDNIKEDLSNVIEPANTDIKLSSGFKQFIASFTPWILMMIFSAFGRKGSEASDAILGFLVIGLPLAFIGSLLPSSWSYYVVYLLYPGGHFLIVVVLILIYQKRKTV